MERLIISESDLGPAPPATSAAVGRSDHPRVALVLLAVVAVGGVLLSQLLIPSIAAHRARAQLAGRSSHLTVNVSAFPAVRLIGGGGRVTVKADEIREPSLIQAGADLRRLTGASRGRVMIAELGLGPHLVASDVTVAEAHGEITAVGRVDVHRFAAALGHGWRGAVSGDAARFIPGDGVHLRLSAARGTLALLTPDGRLMRTVAAIPGLSIDAMSVTPAGREAATIEIQASRR